jgi:hypothetical protein
MHKALRFTALVGILSLTGWLCMHTKAEATVYCDSLALHSCSPPGQIVDCVKPDGSPGTCSCSLNFRWVCF